MPIRPELRKFYSAASGWPAVRRRILERAGGRFNERGRYLGRARCEQCKVPDRTGVYRGPEGLWRLTDSGKMWHRNNGHPTTYAPVWSLVGPITKTVLTVAHLNHTPGDDRDENLKALCQWCHLNYDKLHHKETRCLRKDRQRPLLVPA
jgi:hypothetical protein